MRTPAERFVINPRHLFFKPCRKRDVNRILFKVARDKALASDCRYAGRGQYSRPKESAEHDGSVGAEEKTKG